MTVAFAAIWIAFALAAGAGERRITPAGGEEGIRTGLSARHDIGNCPAA